MHPGSGDRTKIVIDASYGLGETIVSGSVTPDHFVVDKVLLEPLEQTIGDKHVELVADPAAGRTVERDVDPARAARPCLDAGQLRAVAQLAKRAERHYGCPQDVEWALTDGEVVLLQSRPETVWANKEPSAPVPNAYATGLTSMANTLINPLAARSPADVRH